MTVTLTESRPLAEAATPAEGPGRLRVRIIDAGVGSSGVYPAETLEAAAKAKVFAAGTQMFLDHETESEKWDRPERSVRDLAGRLATDAVFENGALFADVETFPQWRDALAAMADTIGVSIRADAIVETGDFEGRLMPIVQEIVSAKSVDFVTKAGRGGRIEQVIESARSVDRAIAHGVAEATANDRRAELGALLKATYQDTHTYTWVRDFDDTQVWFEVDGPEQERLFQQGYETTDDVATALTGTPVQVRVQIQYVPVPVQPAATQVTVTSADEADTQTTIRVELDPSIVARLEDAAEAVRNFAAEVNTSVPTSPAGQSTATESTKEDTMATTQIEESRLAQLEKDAGRATALESERDTAVRERDEARRALVESQDLAAAQRIVAEADVQFDDLQTAGLIASAPRVAESGRIDLAAFKKDVEARAAKLSESKGAGRVRYLGTTQPPTGGEGTVSEADLDRQLAGIFGRTVKEA